MAHVNEGESESLSEYLVLPSWIKNGPEEVSLEVKLGESITLQYPYLTARMQSVVGPEMAIAAGRQGILTCIPRSLRDVDKQTIINANNAVRLKEGKIEYLDDPESVRMETSYGETIAQVERTGHSVIPVLDRFSKYYGCYVHNPDNPLSVPHHTPISEVMDSSILVADTREKAEQMLADTGKRFVPIVDSNDILRELAFVQKYDTNFIGMALSTREGWEEELEMWGEQVDTLMIDSSNACFADAINILQYAKTLGDKPFGIGNIVRAEHFNIFAEAGADYIIGGMGVGSICQTGSRRGNARGQFTVAQRLAAARDEFAQSDKGRYVPIVIDGGIRNVKDMTVALAFGDLLMMGSYFNKFNEAAGKKFDANKEPVFEEAAIRYVETWGEGHPRARLVAMYGLNFEDALRNPDPDDVSRVVERYGHASVSSSTVEGVVGTTEYRGRLKPNVEEDARYIRTTMSNAGAGDLKEFREKAVLEKASAATMRDMLPHDIEVTER